MALKWGPTSRRPKPMEAVPLRNNISVTNGKGAEVEREKVDSAPSPGVPGENPPRSPAAIPVPDSPSLSARAPSSPSPAVQQPEPASSFDRHCAQSQSPAINRAPCGGLTWDRLHERCTQRGYPRKDAQNVLRTRLASTDAAESNRVPLGGYDMDTAGKIAGRREWAPSEGAMDPDIPAQPLGRNATWAIFTWPLLWIRKQ